jgi:hypothetical protein
MADHRSRDFDSLVRRLPGIVIPGRLFLIWDAFSTCFEHVEGLSGLDFDVYLSVDILYAVKQTGFRALSGVTLQCRPAGNFPQPGCTGTAAGRC